METYASKTHHPLPGYCQRTRGKGRALPEPARRRRPGGTGRASTSRRRGRAGISSTSQPPTKAAIRSSRWCAGSRTRFLCRWQVGGGIRAVEDMRRLLLAGADKVSVNSAAVRSPALLSEGAERFGSQCVVLAIDARRAPGRLTAGKYLSTAGACPPAKMRSNGPWRAWPRRRRNPAHQHGARCRSTILN